MNQSFFCLLALFAWLLVLTSSTEAQRGHFLWDNWGGDSGHVTDSTIKLGISTEALHRIVRQHVEQPERQTPEIATLATKLAINDRQVQAALTMLDERKVVPWRLAAHLFEIADQFKTLRTIVAVAPDDSDDTAAMKADARNAIDVGDLTKAQQLLSAPAARGEIALARLQHLEAAEHFADAAASTMTENVRIWYLIREADALYRYNEAIRAISGMEAGLKSVYADVMAVIRYRQLVGLISREQSPGVWAMMQNNLGAAIHKLVFRSAFRGNWKLLQDVCTHNRSRFCRPLEEARTESFETAVAAYREALKESSRENMPLYWAITQANLGATLLSHSKRNEGNQALLEAAIAAYREALTEFTRERTPGTWAAIQGSLAQSLGFLGQRGNDAAAIQEAAITARREALKEWTRERVPSLWALAQRDLGDALAAPGWNESGTSRLREAVVAYREALKEAEEPSHRQLTLQILAAVLRVVGERDNDAASLEEAVASARESLKLIPRQPGVMEYLRGHVQNILADALRALGERQTGTSSFEEAVTAYSEAREVLPGGSKSVHWASIRADEGLTLMLIAERRQDVGLAETALSQVNGAFELIRDQGEPTKTALTTQTQLDGYRKVYHEQLERARTQRERATAIIERLR